MSEKPAKSPLDRPIPWLAVVAIAALSGTLIILIAGAILNRMVNNACVGDCLTTVDTTMQAHMALAAWSVLVVSAISGAVSIYLIYRTLQAAQRSAKAAEDALTETRVIGRAQTRAYVAIERAAMVGSSHGGPKSIEITYRNAGQSPALKLSIDVRIAIVDHMQFDAETLSNLRGGMALANLNAGAEATRIVRVWDFDPTAILDDTEKSPLAAHVNLILRYIDVFDEQSETAASFQWWFGQGEAIPERIEFAALS
jgi:hypothetical protein